MVAVRAATTPFLISGKDLFLFRRVETANYKQNSLLPWAVFLCFYGSEVMSKTDFIPIQPGICIRKSIP